MFLVRLKLGLFEQDLAHRFMIHRSSVCRRLITRRNVLYFLLESQMIRPSRDDVNKHMPKGFKKLYPSTRVILDCAEYLFGYLSLYSCNRSSTQLIKVIQPFKGWLESLWMEPFILFPVSIQGVFVIKKSQGVVGFYAAIKLKELNSRNHFLFLKIHMEIFQHAHCWEHVN